MADLIYNKTGGLGANVNVGFPATDFDILYAFLKTKVEDSNLLKEYTDAYLQVAQLMNISLLEFVTILKNQGSDFAQDAFIAGYLNQIRYKNSKLGIGLNAKTPVNILREIRA